MTAWRSKVAASLRKAAVALRASAPDIGFFWESRDGTRVIEQRQLHPTSGKEVFLVSTNGNQKFMAIIPVDQLEKEVSFDTRSLASQKKTLEKQKAEEEAEAAKKAERDDLDGFEKGMSPLAKKRALDALSKSIVFNGKLSTRRDYIRQRVAQGWGVVVHPKHGRMFQGPEGNLLLEKDLTKIGLDYADFLVTKGGKTSGSATEDEVDRSADETVMEYAKQFLLKKKVKTIAAAARSTAKKLSGGENMMLGPGVTIIDAKKLEAALSDYIRDYGNQNGIWMAQHTFNLSDDEAAKLGISGSVRAGLMLSAGMKYDPENQAHRQELADKMKEKLGAAGFKLSTDRTRDPGRQYGGGFKGKEEVWVFQHRKDPGLEVQVFTSITSGGEVRSKGADAIRVCLVYKNKAKQTGTENPDAKQYDLGSECRVHRTGDIDDIVERTVERARESYKKANEVERCRDCQAPMATSKAGKRFCSEVCWTKKPGYQPKTSASSKAGDFGFSEREVFYPLAKAKKLAEEAAKGDPDWTYQVMPPDGNSRGMAKVVVFDEDGEEIGSL